MNTDEKNTTTGVPEEIPEKKEPAYLKVVEPLQFDANIKSCFINTIELSKVVDSLFAQAFRDYVGCKISLNNGNLAGYVANEIMPGKLYVSLFFKDRSNCHDDYSFVNVVRRGTAVDGASILSKLNIMSGMNAGRIYDITPETYEALDPYRFFPNRKAVWANLTSEMTTSYGYLGSTNQEIVVCVTGLDLERILCEIYGTRTDEGIFQYQATPVQLVANVNGEYVIQITQLDVNKLSDLRKQLGGPVMQTEFHPCR